MVADAERSLDYFETLEEKEKDEVGCGGGWGQV